MNKVELDIFFLGVAKQFSTRSRDTSTKVGAVIVDRHQNLRSEGWNGFPRKVDDSVIERYSRPIKYLWTEHAERNAIYSAARAGVALDGCTIYCTHAPCADCARAVIQAGIARFVYPFQTVLPTYVESTKVAFQMLDESKVEVTGIKL